MEGVFQGSRLRQGRQNYCAVSAFYTVQRLANVIRQFQPLINSLDNYLFESGCYYYAPGLSFSSRI
jgi:hypothetical protein